MGLASSTQHVVGIGHPCCPGCTPHCSAPSVRYTTTIATFHLSKTVTICLHITQILGERGMSLWQIRLLTMPTRAPNCARHRQGWLHTELSTISSQQLLLMCYGQTSLAKLGPSASPYSSTPVRQNTGDPTVSHHTLAISLFVAVGGPLKVGPTPVGTDDGTVVTKVSWLPTLVTHPFPDFISLLVFLVKMRHTIRAGLTAATSLITRFTSVAVDQNVIMVTGYPVELCLRILITVMTGVTVPVSIRAGWGSRTPGRAE